MKVKNTTVRDPSKGKSKVVAQSTEKKEASSEAGVQSKARKSKLTKPASVPKINSHAGDKIKASGTKIAEQKPPKEGSVDVTKSTEKAKAASSKGIKKQRGSKGEK